MSRIIEAIQKLVNQQITQDLEKREHVIKEEIVRIYKLHNDDKECDCEYCAGMRKAAGTIDAEIFSKNSRNYRMDR